MRRLRLSHRVREAWRCESAPQPQPLRSDPPALNHPFFISFPDPARVSRRRKLEFGRVQFSSQLQPRLVPFNPRFSSSSVIATPAMATKTWTALEVRNTFLDFFEKRGHTIGKEAALSLSHVSGLESTLANSWLVPSPPSSLLLCCSSQ